MPSISVLMPAYNHQQFVEEAVRSVWDQTFKDIELIVIDDGSKDGTPDILNRLAQASPIAMTVEVQSNSGISRTLNRAIEMARGEWISFLGSDDYYHPEFLAANMDLVARHRGSDVVQHSNAYLVEQSGAVTGILDDVSMVPPLGKQAFEALVAGNGRLLPASMFLSRDLLRRVGAFDPNMIAEDYDAHLRLSRVADFVYLDRPLVYSRYTPGSLGKQPWVWGEGIIKSLEKHADVLGDRLPDILSFRAGRISLTCFEYGRWKAGMLWAGKSIGYAKAPASKVAAALKVAANGLHGISRRGAYRLVGRERLVRLKRKLQRNARTEATN